MDTIPTTEEITFRPDGSSHHIWRLADGTVIEERTFDPSPVYFGPWPLHTAKERGIVSVKRILHSPS